MHSLIYWASVCLQPQLSPSDNWPFLTPNVDGKNVSDPLPPFNHSGFSVGIYDHMALAYHFASELNFSSVSPTALFGNGENVSSTLSNVTRSVTNAIMRWDPELAAL